MNNGLSQVYCIKPEGRESVLKKQLVPENLVVTFVVKLYIALQCVGHDGAGLTVTCVCADLSELLTFHLLLSSTDNICKQFRPRTGPTFSTKCQACSGSKLFDILKVWPK